MHNTYVFNVHTVSDNVFYTTLNMYHVSAQGVEERMINVHYNYYCYYYHHHHYYY